MVARVFERLWCGLMNMLGRARCIGAYYSRAYGAAVAHCWFLSLGFRPNARTLVDLFLLPFFIARDIIKG